MNTKKCYVFTSFGDIETIKLELNNDDLVIAADGGYDKAKLLGICPNIIIGDLDSIKGNYNKDIEIIKHNIDKDDTDTFLAVKEGLKRGFKDFVVIGGLGGRLDHCLANISLLKFIYENNSKGIIIDNKNEVRYLSNGKIELSKNNRKSISILAYSNVAKGVTIKGVKYSLDNAIISNSFPIGISNSFLEEKAEISVKEGELIIIVFNE